MNYPIGNHKIHDSTTLTRKYMTSCAMPLSLEDLEHLDNAIASLVTDGCLAVPGLAHIRNKVAYRVGEPLITTGDEPGSEE